MRATQRQGRDQRGVDEGVNGHGRAEPERHRQDGGHGKPRRFHEVSQGEAKILHQVLESREGLLVAPPLARGLEAAKSNRAAPRLVR